MKFSCPFFIPIFTQLNDNSHEYILFSPFKEYSNTIARPAPLQRFLANSNWPFSGATPFEILCMLNAQLSNNTDATRCDWNIIYRWTRFPGMDAFLVHRVRATRDKESRGGGGREDRPSALIYKRYFRWLYLCRARDVFVTFIKKYFREGKEGRGGGEGEEGSSLEARASFFFLSFAFSPSWSKCRVRVYLLNRSEG